MIDYDYKTSGIISESKLVLKKSFSTSFFEKPINRISLLKTNIEMSLSKKNNNFLRFDGLYSLFALENKKFKVTYNLNEKNPKYLIDFDLPKNIFLELINFKTNHKSKSNIKMEFNFINNNITFKNLNFTEGKNSISINGLKLNKKMK